MSTATENGVGLVGQFTDIVRDQMASQEITVRELAQKAGMGYPYLYRVLKGEQSPTIATVERITDALGLSLKITP